MSFGVLEITDHANGDATVAVAGDDTFGTVTLWGMASKLDSSDFI